MKIPIPPFLVAPDTTVEFSGWKLIAPDGDIPLPTELDDWDYQTTLNLVASVSVDRGDLLAACELDAESQLSLLVTAHSNSTRTTEQFCLETLPLGDGFDLQVRAAIPGEEFGGRLTIDTFLLVAEPRPMSRLAPQHPGSIIWRTRQSTLLQGVGSQFPTDAIDFRLFPLLDSRAGWKFEVDMADLEAPFLAAARLKINAGDATMLSVLNGATDVRSADIRRLLKWDITRQMVFLALGVEDVLSLEFNPTASTVGGVLRNVLQQVWPKESTTTLKNWMQETPSRIEMGLQHHCNLLGGA